MAKLWAKVKGNWVSLGAQSKDDVGLGNVENFTHTNSAKDGSSSKYATGAAVKQAYDRATQALSKAKSAARLGKIQYTRSRNEMGTVLPAYKEGLLPDDAVVVGVYYDGYFNRFKYRKVL